MKMMNKIKNVVMLSMLMITSACALPNAKMYLNEQDVDTQYGIHVHVGNNMWIETKSITRDTSGLYTFESDIQYYWGEEVAKKKWKCPYCYKYYDVGVACSDPECPSKY